LCDEGSNFKLFIGYRRRPYNKKREGRGGEGKKRREGRKGSDEERALPL